MACVHFYMCADDTQLHIDFSPEDEGSAHVVIAECVRKSKHGLLKFFAPKSGVALVSAETITVGYVNKIGICTSVFNL